MKASQFLLNTDYLSLAQVDKSDYTVNVNAGTLAAGANTVQNFDFTTSTQDGLLDRAIIKKDNDEFMYGAKMHLEPVTDVVGDIQVFRTSATNLRVEFMLENTGASSASYPAMDFVVKIVSFKLPNML